MKFVKLGEVARVFNGNSINEKVKSQNFTNLDEGIPYIATKDVSFSFEVNYENGTSIPAERSKEFKLAKAGNVLICAEGGSAGRKIAILDRDVHFGNKLFCFETTEQLNSRFLFYSLQAPFFQNLFKESITGLIGGVSLEKVRNLPIALPKLEKQREIVHAIDSAFNEITSLKENLERRKAQIEVLMRSATTTPYLRTPGVNFREIKLGEVSDFEGGSQPAKSNFVYKELDGYVRFIQIRDFGSDKNLTYIPISSKNRLCDESDILIGRYGASVGKILTGLSGAYNVALMKVIPKKNIIEKDYLYYYLLSDLFQDNLAKVSDRSAQNGFSKEDICSFALHLPSLDEQKLAVSRLSEIRREVDSLKSKLERSESLLASLKSSLLDRVFPQNSEAA